MPRTFTDEQLSAITLEGDLLVSAAAGAGKTAVLTERIARLIYEGAPVESFLVVTFTNAAAAEMRERIEERLKELSKLEPDLDGAARLTRAAAACDRANISTLHSFCVSVLKRNFSAAGVDPAFRAAEPADADILFNKAMDAALEEKFRETETSPDPAFDALLTAAGSDEKLAELIKKLFDFAESRPDPDGWLDLCVSRMTDGAEETLRMLEKRLVEDSRNELEHFAARARALRVELPEDQRGIAKALDSDLGIMLSLSLAEDYESWVRGLPEASFERLNWNRGTDPAEKEEVAGYRKRFKDCIDRLRSLFAHSSAEEETFIRLLAPPVVELVSLVRRFKEKYAGLKEDAGVIDFRDMEQLTLKVLKDPGVAEEYRRRFRYIFVDEYQDVNPAQEAILSAVSHGNRFLVGDVKQSIYRFRQADPTIFIDKYRSYDGSLGRIRIDLNRNFRSSPVVLDAVNAVFSELMRGEKVGEIDYSDNAALVSGKPEVFRGAGEVSITLIDPKAGGPEAFTEPGEPPFFDPEGGSQETGASLEAAYAAKKILHIMENCTVPEADGARKYRYSDFAILLRSAKGVVRDWMSTLALYGIPCVTAAGEGFYESIEVRLFMSLLRVIDNRRQDIPLLAVMRSPIFMFTDEDLVHIRADHREKDILSSVVSAAKDPASPPWGVKCRGMLEALDRWRMKQRIMELSDFVACVLDETRLRAYVSSLYGGTARAENLETLVALAGSFSASGGSLSGFIAYMDDSKKTSKLPAALQPVCDAVKLMTIHSSKGLEFDTVILGGITRAFRRTYNSDVGIFDSELGIGLCSVSGDRKLKSILQRAIAMREATRLNAEEMRLLYVAMTRAKTRLIMTGVKDKAEEKAASLAKPLDAVRIMRANNYADWLFGALFPAGIDDPPVFPSGGTVSFAVTGSAVSGASRGMTPTVFAEWLQKAAFTDASRLRERFALSVNDGSADIPSKLSVTALSKEPVRIESLPRFMTDRNEFTAAERGTLTHRLMQLVSIRPHTDLSVREELRALTERGFFTEEEANAADVSSVANFFSSDLGRRMIASPRVEREREFDMLIGANELPELETAKTASVMLQGVIDCCFIEDGEWVLVDHKTSKVDRNHSARTVAERYRRQIELYSKALYKLTGIRVKAGYVYLLSAGIAVEM
ncbi:MAG: UvrD-helicase domain-containing protein [Clostridia bacterium]|nr:UvrD-helicase domain-containing protein [Clostridia bacterium]